MRNFLKSSLGIAVPVLTALCVSQTVHAEVYKVVDSKTGKVVYTDKPQNFAKNLTDTTTVAKMAMPSSDMSAHRGYPNEFAANGYSVNNNPVNNNSTNHTQSYRDQSYRNQSRNQYNNNLTRSINNTSHIQSNVLNTKSNQAQKNNKIKPKTVTASDESPDYQINIITPAKERAYHRPSQHVVITSSVTPSLQNGDYVIVLIDGKEMAKGTDVKINTLALEAGTHEITVTVVNKYGRKLISGANKKVHVIQHNVAIKKKREKKAKVAEYKALPWYKKIVRRNPEK